MKRCTSGRNGFSHTTSPAALIELRQLGARRGHEAEFKPGDRQQPLAVGLTDQLDEDV